MVAPKDNWEHKLVFKGSKLARDARPLFTAIYGCAPVEDAGGLYGWEEVKAAFRASHPTPEQRERMKWAKDASGRGASYSPLAEPDIIPMNYEGRWENRLKGFMQDYGERWRP
ncbi:hypothetical protein FIBSPDRAFT_583706 [Athelia psychrophila]|uniref:Plasmid pRiA4b Orf3-like domain-containing protein n=1 Tax=Athelia psychrophila TaxID=1759441 RepID=A0A166HEP7_9AGAM|nr:hypothetical protein FIBSPDRAFT_583706 [Fibularhizoctonia sp. CBS 109695]